MLFPHGTRIREKDFNLYFDGLGIHFQELKHCPDLKVQFHVQGVIAHQLESFDQHQGTRARFDTRQQGKSRGIHAC